MNNNEHIFQNMMQHNALPPHVYSVWLIDNGKRMLKAKDEWDEFKHLFDWVDEMDIRNRILNLKNITLENHKSIVAIYGDKTQVIDFANKDLNFEPPPLYEL